MADKKTIKNTKPAKEIKTVDQLIVDLASKTNDLIEARRGHKLGELANTCVIRTTRKEIARINTAIRAAKVTELKENK
jgi:ribosomal protein L29